MAPRHAALGLALCVLLAVSHAVSGTTAPRPSSRPAPRGPLRAADIPPTVFPKGPAVRLPVPTPGPTASTSDSLELSEDKDLIYEDLLEHHSVVCPKPMCECRHVGSGGIAAKCSTLDFKGQRFQGIVNHLEVSNAPEFDDGLFLLNNSLASLGLQFLTTVKISNSSIKGLSLFTFEGLTDLYDVDLSYNHIMIPHQDVFLKNTVLRKLSLRGNPLGVSQVVENTLEKSHLLNSASLNELDLSQCDLDFLSPHIFSRMKHLERLLLAGNKLKTLYPETLSGLGELEELDLSSNYIREITTAMFVNNTELTELHLRNNSLHSLAGVEILGLDELDVSENWFESIDNDTFLGFPALTRLNMSDNAVRRVDPKALEPLRHLQDLDLSGNEIQGPLPRELLAACEVLETLNLSDNPRMEGLPAGGFQGMFSALYQLDLSYTGLRALEEDSFLGMDHLSILNLQGNQLSEVGAGVLRRLPQLVTLDLSDNMLTALDTKTFQTNGFLRHLDLSGNPLATVSPHVFSGTPYLRWLDLSHCKLTALWETQAGHAGADRVTLLRKLGHLNVAGNRIETLRVSEVALAGGLAVLDISNNPLKCTKELHYLMEWLVKHSVTPRSDRKLTGALQNDLMHAVEDMMEERSLRGRWASVYDAMCGPSAFDEERAKLQQTILASESKPAEPAQSAPESPVKASKGVTEEELDDIKMVLGKKKILPPADEDEDEDDSSYSDDTDSTVEEAEDEDDDDDDDDEDDDEYDDRSLIVDAGSNGTDYMAFSHHASPYLWPVLTIAALLATTVLIVSNVVVCVLRRSRARRHARFQSPMFRHLGHLPPQHKTFGGIPGSFIKTKKDGGFVYKKLYEETTTPNAPVYFPQVHTNTFKFPLDPSDLQDPSRV